MLIVETAKKVLADEYQELEINIHMPDEERFPEIILVAS